MSYARGWSIRLPVRLDPPSPSCPRLGNFGEQLWGISASAGSDGDDTLTYDPGRPWTRNQPGTIEHVYETLGRYDLSVEVVWEAQWRINGGAWQPLGFFSLSDSVDYPVRQVQARLTRTNN